MKTTTKEKRQQMQTTIMIKVNDKTKETARKQQTTHLKPTTQRKRTT